MKIFTPQELAKVESQVHLGPINSYNAKQILLDVKLEKFNDTVIAPSKCKYLKIFPRKIKPP